ncbi:MAG: TlpA disulfide reductase family protein [Gammaproteobacteria bacterium]
MTPSRQILLLVAIMLISGAGGYLAYRASVPQPAPAVAATMPSFVLPDLTGSDRDSNEWANRPRLVNFWATWCPPCRREIPLLIELQNQYGADLAVIGIAIDDMDAVREYAVENQFNYPVLVGQQNAVEVGNQVLADWIGLPFTAFVSASGEVVRVHVGELHRDQAEAFLREIL